MPVLFITGNHDPYVSTPHDLALLMRYAPKNSCQKIISGGVHILFLEKPYYKNFQQDVVSFLRQDCSVLTQ